MSNNSMKNISYNGTDDILINHFSKSLEDDMKLGFYPFFIGYEKCLPIKPARTPSTSDGYCFHFVLNGTGYIEKNKKKTKITANSVFYISPKWQSGDGAVSYYPDSEEPWEYVWINISGEETEKLISCAKLNEKNNFYTMKNPVPLRHKLLEMIMLAQNPVKRSLSFYMPYIMSYFCEIASERKSFKFTQTKKQERVKQILDKIEDTYLNVDFSLKKIADELFYSLSYVSRIFKDEMSVSPIEYVTSLRMLKAKELLSSESENKTVAQVSFECGYSSPYYFSREFKKYFGFPPSKFRNQ